MSSAKEIYELVKAMPEEDISKVLEFVKSLQQKANSESSKKRKPLSNYLGLLKDSPTFKGNPVEIQRRLRNEWDQISAGYKFYPGDFTTLDLLRESLQVFKFQASLGIALPMNAK